MRAIAWLRKYSIEVAWTAFAAVNVAAMVVDASWETVPFHFVWISLTIVYGFRVWSNRMTTIVLAAVIASTGAPILIDAFAGVQLWGELFEVPLMTSMFLAMVWHARRRQAAVAAAESLVEQQERFLHDVSHELRTPVAIARGHLDLVRKHDGERPEVAVAVEELDRMDRIISRLLLLAKTEQPGFLAFEDIDAAAFVEDVFMRWSEVAPRGWRLGSLAGGTVRADEESLRDALDALLENAVKYTNREDRIELRSFVVDYGLVIEVIDSGLGIPADALETIFERFARGDQARTRATGGAGLGLAIVGAVARAHGGTCTARSTARGTTFALRLPRYVPADARDPLAQVTDPVFE